MMYKEIELDVSGLGIIMYSDFAVKHIKKVKIIFQNTMKVTDRF
ncbi:hypothetical protein ABCY62_02115 [Acetivibrio clariflavus]